jgi:hypothetical protein
MDDGNGRRVHVWRNTDALADEIAAAVELFNQDNTLVQLDSSGQLSPVSLAGLRSLIDASICGVKVVNCGTRWQREFFTFAFNPRPRTPPPTQQSGLPTAQGPTTEPDAEVLREIYQHALLPRVPRVV